MAYTAPTLPWETPELTNINRLPAGSCLIPYPDPAAAATYDRTRSDWYASLNGTWSFRLYTRPDEVPAAVLEAQADESGFRSMPVPSNWTLEDTGDRPIYTNVKMPFENTPPHVPEANPTGVYRTTFALPKGWNGRRTVVHFGGVESYYELYVNGRFAGMAKDTRLPSEFDITRLLAEGENTLAVKVVRWSDSSYIEDQDQWWMAGIYRDVYLYSTAPAYLADAGARADYDYRARKGLLAVDAHFAYVPVTDDDPWARSGPTDAFTIEGTLIDPNETTVWSASARIDPSFRVGEYDVKLDATLPGVRPWSSESPSLYRLVLTLVAPDGSPVESRCIRVGFRRVELGDRELLINGRPVLIRGVNRHEHDDQRGKVMTRELMLRDITTLKRFNFNAVRTSHYPDTMEWYDLCDEYGIYLVDEANIEAHANYHSICRDPRWARAFEERMMRMVVRDRNHPSVIAWSAGNETGHGENHVRAIERIRAYDPSRPIHHEGEVKRWWHQRGNEYNGGRNRSNDLINPMYPTIESIVEHAVESRDPRPVILCEYSHAMGNSNGSLAEYWDAFERFHGLQGGFIWEWVDHGIKQTDEKGREYWAYGGDFGEEIHDSNFVADGLVWPDRTPHPAMHEFRKLAQPLAVRALSVGEGRFVVVSKQDFTSLDWLEGRWQLEVEGEPVDGGELPPLEVPPAGELVVKIDYRDPEALERPEAYLRFTFTAREATSWCDAGHEVGWEQFRANDLRLPSPVERGDGAFGSPLASAGAGSQAGPSTITVADEPELAIAIESTTLVERGPSLNLFRATTDNDGIRGWAGQEDKPMGQWLAAGLDALRLVERDVERPAGAGGGTRTDGGTPPLFVERTKYVGSDENAVISCEQTIRRAGPALLRFDVAVDAPSSLPSLPRIGVILETVPGFERLEWFGRGPWENHIDRKEGYPVGRYRGSVAEQYVPYIMPQENGSKCEVRWFELSNGTHVLRFVADPFFEFSAHHFTPADLFACRHANEVEDRLRPQTVVSIDHRQRGVGTGSCGPQTRGPYCIAPGRYEFGFWMEVRQA